MRDFTQLVVWQRAHAVTLELYRVTGSFPRSELFGITGQIRRAAASIGANIAEGCGKYSAAELLRFLMMASGSASELRNHLLLARDLGYLQNARYCELDAAVQEVRRMLTGFAQHLRGEKSLRADG